MTPHQINKLRRAENLKSRIINTIGVKGVVQLAKDGILPHYIISNPITKEETMWFSSNEVNTWFSENCCRHNNGHFVQRYNFSYFNDPQYIVGANRDGVPKELLQVNELYSFPLGTVYSASGIYFLCLDKKIQYIGQSTVLSQRIHTHLTEKEKTFSHIYFITCPENQLNDLERELIKRFNPPLNGKPKNKKKIRGRYQK